MNSYLLNRAIGSISPQALERAQTTRLLHALQPAPSISFSNGRKARSIDDTVGGRDGVTHNYLAHPAGVNTIAIDKFEGRYLLAGGADSSISIWDLEDSDSDVKNQIVHEPLGSVTKTASAHKFGITHLSFYPFDSLAFLSSSYDHSLKVYSSETLTASASFDLSSVVYSHALSPIASHLLVACATEHPAIRLVDLRSGASAHSLAGHHGAVLTVAWHPLEPHLLASGGSDGAVRFWDIRRSASSLGVLDMEDSVGLGALKSGTVAQRHRERGKAHTGPVNGLTWTDNGQYVVTTGHDERIRVWDTVTGANTLASFGPMVKNKHLSSLLPLLAPSSLVAPGKDVLFYPSEREILVYELFDGQLLKRLRTPAATAPAATPGGTGLRNMRNRTTALAWRAHDVELYSAHADGSVRAWRPRTSADALVEEEEEEEEEDEEEREGANGRKGGGGEGKKRKRDVLEDVYRDLTSRKVTFS
ncbi:WD40-repeat-containing domain protein [Cryomyces antarcticus]